MPQFKNFDHPTSEKSQNMYETYGSRYGSSVMSQERLVFNSAFPTTCKMSRGHLENEALMMRALQRQTLRESGNMPSDGRQLDGETHPAVTSAVKWARGLSVHRSVGLLTCGDRSLTRRADRDVTDARLSA